MKTTILRSALCLLTLSVSAAAPLLPSGKAPFKNTAQQKVYQGKVKFDQANRTFSYGNKKLIFRENGTFSLFSSSRHMANAYVFIATPYQYWMTNQGPASLNKAYMGKSMQITSIRTDKDSLTMEGKIPWNKKAEPSLVSSWSVKARILDANKVELQYIYVIPKGKKRVDDGIFMSVKNCRAVRIPNQGDWLPGSKKNFRSFKHTVLSMEGVIPSDSFKVQAANWSTQSSIRFGFHRGRTRIVIDFDKAVLQEKITHPGGVDLEKTDALQVPQQGKNLLPNPYFADKHQFFNAYHIINDDYFTTDALFGRYALGRIGWHRVATVPLDAGQYVWSYYAKGKGVVTLMLRSAGGRSKRFGKPFTKYINTKGKWKRYSIPFRFPLNNALVSELRISKGVIIDGIQLEKGTKATAFEAPAVEAVTAGNFFFKSKSSVVLPFEFSTLKDKVAVKGTMSITNFFGEKVYTKRFSQSVSKGKYPKLVFRSGKLPDGIYVIKMDYGKTAPAQFFRFAVMPFLKNTHKTARVFSLSYFGHSPITRSITDHYLARLQAIGIGTNGHANQISQAVADKYAKYNVIPFDAGMVSRTRSPQMKKYFPELKNIPEGRMWFFVSDSSKSSWSTTKYALLPDYRLVGGWNASYRKKFMDEIIRQVRKYPKRYAYRFASEWPMEIKNDPHYVDLYIAFREAVKSVYPDAYVYEAGDCNMDVHGGVATYDTILKRLAAKGTVTDFAGSHTYVKDIRLLYTNFRAFVDMLSKHKGYEKCRIALPEGMHFYAYNIPAWDFQQISWMGEGWRGTALSYDLGWSEKISAAYFARSYLTYLTEFDRVWCGTASAGNTNNFIMDTKLTPRAFQKIPNTLGTILGNPKAYLGNFTFAPDTKCLVWEDEKGRPVAAVWNEDPAVDSGYKDAPLATLNYKGAEYLDLMGVKRKCAVDGVFPVSAFPLFIRGRAGDSKAFTNAIAKAVLDDPDKLPCRISFELKDAKSVTLSLINPLARELKGVLTVTGKKYPFHLKSLSSQALVITLPRPLRKGVMEKISLPYSCTIGKRVINNTVELNCFLVPRFKGSWKGIPMIKLANLTDKKGNVSPKDFSARWALAWDGKNIYLRTEVKDDVFTPGKGNFYRWNYDVLQVYFDTRCSAMKTGKRSYDEDDYEYGFMPTVDGKRCEVYRALSPDIQLTLGIGAPKNKTLAPEIPAKFTRTKDGYIYEGRFPADYVLPIQLRKSYNFAFGLYAADRDKGRGAEKGLSNASRKGAGCYNRPHLWPIAVLVD